MGSPLHEIWNRLCIGGHNILVSTVFTLVRPLNPDLLLGTLRTGPGVPGKFYASEKHKKLG
jgi:hypothetical protein